MNFTKQALIVLSLAHSVVPGAASIPKKQKQEAGVRKLQAVDNMFHSNHYANYMDNAKKSDEQSTESQETNGRSQGTRKLKRSSVEATPKRHAANLQGLHALENMFVPDGRRLHAPNDDSRANRRKERQARANARKLRDREQSRSS